MLCVFSSGGRPPGHRCVFIRRSVPPMPLQAFRKGPTLEIITIAAPMTTAARDYTVY